MKKLFSTHDKLAGLKGVLVAPGFGDRGMEGKIAAIKYSFKNFPFMVNANKNVYFKCKYAW